MAGLHAILVRTGKYRDGDENLLDNNKPTAICNNFSDAVEFLLN